MDSSQIQDDVINFRERSLSNLLK